MTDPALRTAWSADPTPAPVPFPGPGPDEYLASDVAANLRIELEEARAERDRALGFIAVRVQQGRIDRIDPDHLERAARLVRAVRLLAPILEHNTTGG